MFQTIHGSLTKGLALSAGETLLIRGGTSSIGMAAARMAKRMGATVIGTIRNPDKLKNLEENGDDDAVLDSGEIVQQVLQQYPGGVDKVLELVGTVTLRASLATARPGGVVCVTGILSVEWTLQTFTLMEDIPHTMRLTVYTGEAKDLDIEALQHFLNDVAAGREEVVIDQTFSLTEIQKAHRYMEDNHSSGKLVVVLDA